MRNLIISVLCLGILITVWGFYDNYTDKKLKHFTSEIQDTIIRDIEDKKWNEAYNKFEVMSKDWHDYRKSANFFLDTQALNDADYSFAKAIYYIKAKDESNAPGELACLKDQLDFLHRNEGLSWENIF